jgi:hypothetical protein
MDNAIVGTLCRAENPFSLPGEAYRAVTRGFFVAYKLSVSEKKENEA